MLQNPPLEQAAFLARLRELMINRVVVMVLAAQMKLVIKTSRKRQ
jgi:hypothetical protein